MIIHAKRACLESGWASDVRVELIDGHIAGLSSDTASQSGDICVDTLLPALCNLHSHSFQRAMAGMTEFRAKGRESFWTWRDLMYRFLGALTPDQIGIVAQQAFMEMQLAGYAAVGEFHYLHHGEGGQTYDNPAELSQQIMQAAMETGIGLTHLPVLYSYGGIGGEALTGGQFRFGNSPEEFSALVENCHAFLKELPKDTRVGIAPHSLRATLPDELKHILENHPQGPVHIHIAEQVKEVEDVQAHYKARPVEWLLNNFNIDGRWCLIHATHMTEEETKNFAKSGAVAGLCPVTEANLGDGIFNGRAYLGSGGKFGVGTDSNINISLIEELRTLEYSQRLKHQERNVLAGPEGSVGEALYMNAAGGGAQALDRNAGQIAVGKLADLISIDSNDPALCALAPKQLIDGFIFAAKDRAITDVWSAGRHVVQAGHHIAQDSITASFQKTMRELAQSLNAL